MLDLPGIIEGAKDGKGIVLDCLKPLTHKKVCAARAWMASCSSPCDVAIATHCCICTPPRRQSGRTSQQVSASICKYLQASASIFIMLLLLMMMMIMIMEMEMMVNMMPISFGVVPASVSPCCQHLCCS